MTAEIDQSGKIEWTQKPTVIAVANSIKKTIFISAQEKRKLHLALKTHKRSPHKQRIRAFTILLYLLLTEDIDKLHHIVIDVEYTGYNRVIKEHLLNLFRKNGHRLFADQISFAHIGKKSKAHNVAIETFRGKRSPDIRVTAADILREF